MAEEFKKYCISAAKDETSLTFVIPLTEAQYNFFCDSMQMQFTIGDGLHVAFDRLYLDSFEIQPMQ